MSVNDCRTHYRTNESYESKAQVLIIKTITNRLVQTVFEMSPLSLFAIVKKKRKNVSFAFRCTDAEEDHDRGDSGGQVYSRAGRPETQRLGETKRARARCVREDNTNSVFD